MIGKAASYSLFGAAITKVRATRRDAIDRSIDRFFTENLIREKEGGLARLWVGRARRVLNVPRRRAGWVTDDGRRFMMCARALRSASSGASSGAIETRRGARATLRGYFSSLIAFGD